MSEDGVYPSSVPSFLRKLSSKLPVPDTILGVEVARCSIGVFVSVVQNLFTGIPNSTRSLSLG